MKTTALIRTPDVSDEAHPESISSEPPTNAAVGLVALTGAILASPYLLVRRLRTRRSFPAPAPASAPTAQFIPAGSRQRAV
jgi:hypothetical protein